MPVHALNLQDVGKNINIGFYSKENWNTMYGIEICLQTLLENSVSGSWKRLEYSWNFIYKTQHEPWLNVGENVTRKQKYNLVLS